MPVVDSKLLRVLAGTIKECTTNAEKSPREHKEVIIMFYADLF